MTSTQKKQSGPSAPKYPAYVTFSQDLKPEYWPGWNVGLILSGDTRAIGEEAARRCEAAGAQLQGTWFIKHDRDTAADGCLRDSHLHGIFQLSAGRNAEGKLHCREIDAALGWDKSVVRAPGRGGRIENALSYLIHAKDPKKFQYPVSDVVTLRGQDYAEIEESYRSAWARRAVIGRQTVVSRKEWNELGDVLVQRVLDGEIDELDILNDRTLGDIYARNKTNVDLAFSFRTRREMQAEVAKLRAGAFQKTVVWCTGASDQGKSYLVEGVAAQLSELTGWKVFRATAKNGPDDYRGQEIVMMNEPSTKVMEWADFLQLLDPRQAGPISARYANKPDAAPRVILVAVSVDPVDFGFFIPGKRSTSDSLDQLVRRITLMIEAQKIDGAPHYSIGRVGEVETCRHLIEMPGRYERDEVVQISYGPVSTETELTHAEALDVVLDTVAMRSPDAGIESSAQRSLEASRSALAARGIVVDGPLKLVEVAV